MCRWNSILPRQIFGGSLSPLRIGVHLKIFKATRTPRYLLARERQIRQIQVPSR